MKAAVAALAAVVLLFVGFLSLPALFAPATAGACAGQDPPAKGRYTQAQISALWVDEHGPPDQAQIAGAVGMAESQGNPNAVGPPTKAGPAIGLMQILGAVLPGDLRDPRVNMRNAIKKWKDAHGWTPWTTYTSGAYLKYMGKAGTLLPAAAACDSGGPVAGSPKEIIDTVVLPIARHDGIMVTPTSVEAANARHGPTVEGNRSDHQGPPDVAWAADMSNGVTTSQEDQLAQDLAQRFKIPWTGAGLVTTVHGHYRFQLIYRTLQGGNHFTHVHLGVRIL